MYLLIQRDVVVVADGDPALQAHPGSEHPGRVSDEREAERLGDDPSLGKCGPRLVVEEIAEIRLTPNLAREIFLFKVMLRRYVGYTQYGQ